MDEIAAAQKDPEAFRVLYDRYYLPVYKYVFRRTTDKHLTAEICSQVFLKALQNLKRYEFRGVPFSSWLFRIASNELGQFYRNRTQQRVFLIETEQLPDLMEIPAAGPGPEQLQEMLVRALDELRPADLELIEMRFFEKRPFQEIADILAITEANAKVRTYRILERMKKKINEMLDHG